MRGRIIQAPDILEASYLPLLFLAGGITGCSDWQAPVAQRLAQNLRINIANPRRQQWDMNADDSESEKQIIWEYNLLKRTDIFFFWFPGETVCPVTLLELGTCLHRKGPIFIGTDPSYVRRFDVIVQSQLARGKDLMIYDDLDIMVDQIIQSHRNV
jgi:hypothetical protein